MSVSNAFPRISIITPSFNQGHFLEQTIKSVVRQTYPNWEYIILDGGSTDNSISLIKRYAKLYPQIRWQSKKDKGQADALNQGLQLTTGDIIAYINSDDYFHPGSFNKVVKFFRKNLDKNWVVGDCDVSQETLKWTFFLKKINPFHLFFPALLLYNPINQPAVFLRRTLVKKVGNFNPKYRYAFDYDYWLRCAKHGLPGRISSKLATFRVHSSALGNTGYRIQLEEDYQIASHYSDSFFLRGFHFLSKYLTIFFYGFLK